MFLPGRQLHLFFLFALLSCTSYFGQDTAFYFSARVVDSVTSTPAAGARISLKGTFQTAFANEDGRFSMLVSKNRSILEISSPGYNPAYSGTPHLITPGKIISLAPINSAAKNIEAEKKIISFNDLRIKDFTIDSNGVLVLADNYRVSRSILFLLNHEGKIIEKKYISENASGFYTSYENKKYLLGTVFSLEYLIGKNGIIFTDTIPLKIFENQYYTWERIDSTGKYFRFESPDEYYLNPELDVMARQQSVAYYIRTQKSKHNLLFKNYGDERFQKNSYPWKKSYELNFPDLPYIGSKFTYVKTAVQFMQTEKQIVVFDLDNKKIDLFDAEGKPQPSVNLKINEKDVKDSRFILDEASGKYYILQLKNQNESFITKIAAVDLTTGSLKQTIDLSGDCFYSIKIWDGKFYYLKRTESDYAIFQTDAK